MIRKYLLKSISFIKSVKYLIFSILLILFQCKWASFQSLPSELDGDSILMDLNNNELLNNAMNNMLPSFSEGTLPKIKMLINRRSHTLVFEGKMRNVLAETASIIKPNEEDCYFVGHIMEDPSSLVYLDFCSSPQVHGMLSFYHKLYRIVLNPIKYTRDINDLDSFMYTAALFGRKAALLVAVPTSDLHVQTSNQDLETFLSYTFKSMSDQDSALDLPKSELGKYLTVSESDTSKALMMPGEIRSFVLKVAVFTEHSSGLSYTQVRQIMNQVSGYYALQNLRHLDIAITIVHHEFIGSYGRMADSLLRSLGQLVSSRKNGNHQRWDTAIVLRGDPMYTYDSYGKIVPIKGYATVRSLCMSSSVAIVSGNINNYANTVAHELGHNLGLPHDTYGTCRYHYLMAPMYRGQLRWSDCSINLLRNNIHVFGCLTPGKPIKRRTTNYNRVSQNTRSNTRNSYGLLTNEIKYPFDYSIEEPYYHNLHPDNACAIRFKNRQMMAKNGVHRSNCASLVCIESGKSFPEQEQGQAPTGTICDFNMWCFDGICQSTPTTHMNRSDLLRPPKADEDTYKVYRVPIPNYRRYRG